MLFYKKRWEYYNRLCPSVMLSPPKQLDEIQPKLVSVLLTRRWCETAHFLAPPPGALGKGQKVKNYLVSLNFNYKVNFKELKQNFVCLLTNERCETYQTGFSFGHLGHAPGVGLGGTVEVGGVKKKSKFNQSWCVRYLHE